MAQDDLLSPGGRRRQQRRSQQQERPAANLFSFSLSPFKLRNSDMPCCHFVPGLFSPLLRLL